MKSLNKVQSHLIAECFNKLYIGGQFVDAIDGEKIPTYYPATGELLHEFPRVKANDVDAAVAVAEAACGTSHVGQFELILEIQFI